MNLSDLKPKVSKKLPTRKGRGEGSGNGKTAGRGHKGYGTRLHINAIKEHGLCPIHRRSFTGKLVDDAI
jgi:large subunit ribosomal protein L15